MKKSILFILLFFNFSLTAKALEIVYPKTNPVKINANSTFFIGSANPAEKLKINEAEVKVYPNGAFAHFIPLNIGTNTFKVESGKEIINFIIEKPQMQTSTIKKQVLMEYPAMVFQVKKDNEPLRMTPIDGGINRLSHLTKGTQILVNGEKGNFYRVFLNSQLTGWIAKANVEQLPKCPDLTVLKEFKTTENKEFCYYEFDLNSKVPFTIKEEEVGLKLQIFNIYGQPDNTYCLNIPMNKLIGYDTYFEKDKFILKLRKNLQINPQEPLKDLVIAVDAGHGGQELGAIGCCGDKEKDINLAIAKNLKQELENRGAKVIMTREDDSNVSLNERVEIAKKKNSVLLISIHANALPDGANPINNKGTSVYYYHNQAKALAENVINSMTSALGTQNDKVRQGSLALVRPTANVSILIEVAYIINPDDYTLLLDKNFQLNCAKAISNGIEKYICGQLP